MLDSFYLNFQHLVRVQKSKDNFQDGREYLM